MIFYKKDIMAELANAGYSTYRIRQERIFSENTLKLFRRKKPFSLQTLNKLCELFDCQPGDILEYVPDHKPLVWEKPDVEELDMADVMKELLGQ